MLDLVAVLALSIALYALWRTCETKPVQNRNVENAGDVDLFPQPKIVLLNSTKPVCVKFRLKDGDTEIHFASYLRMNGDGCSLKLAVPMLEHRTFRIWHESIREEIASSFNVFDPDRATVLAAHVDLEESLTRTRRYTNVNVKFNRVLLNEICDADPSAETFDVDLCWDSFDIEPQNF